MGLPKHEDELVVRKALSMTYRRTPPTRTEMAKNNILKSLRHLRKVTPSRPDSMAVLAV